jgi:hypothetical protein
MKRFEEEDLKCEGKRIRALWVPDPRDLPKREGHAKQRKRRSEKAKEKMN